MLDGLCAGDARGTAQDGRRVRICATRARVVVRRWGSARPGAGTRAMTSASSGARQQRRGARRHHPALHNLRQHRPGRRVRGRRPRLHALSKSSGHRTYVAPFGGRDGRLANQIRYASACGDGPTAIILTWPRSKVAFGKIKVGPQPKAGRRRKARHSIPPASRRKRPRGHVRPADGAPCAVRRAQGHGWR